MPEARVHAIMQQPLPLWRSVLDALENERCLDLRFRATRTQLRDDDPVPNYKVMKQLALRARLGWMYRPLIFAACLLMPAWSMTQWLLALIICALPRRGRVKAAGHVVATIDANVTLIEDALRGDRSLPTQSWDRDLLRLGRLSAELGPRGVLRCIASHARLLAHVVRIGGARRTDLLLHSRDAFLLTMLALYARNHPSHWFATDDHYQRWAYLLSHHASDLHVVQHGFLDPSLAFAHPFGEVHKLHLRDPMFASEFRTFYRAREIEVFAPTRQLASHPLADACVFLASSFPAIDDEIELVRLLKKSRPGLPVIVKFHPAHHYDARRQELAALADQVVSDGGHPACRVFVSYNSFMEFDYRACGLPTFSMAREGGAAQTASAILSTLASSSTGGTGAVSMSSSRE